MNDRSFHSLPALRADFLFQRLGSEIWDGSYRLKSRCWLSCIPSVSSRVESISLPFPPLEAACIFWLNGTVLCHLQSTQFQLRMPSHLLPASYEDLCNHIRKSFNEIHRTNFIQHCWNSLLFRFFINNQTQMLKLLNKKAIGSKWL